MPDAEGVDLRLALDLQLSERLLDDGKRVAPVLDVHRRVAGGDRQGIPEVEEGIEAF